MTNEAELGGMCVLSVMCWHYPLSERRLECVEGGGVWIWVSGWWWCILSTQRSRQLRELDVKCGPIVWKPRVIVCWRWEGGRGVRGRGAKGISQAGKKVRRGTVSFLRSSAALAARALVCQQV